MNFCFIIFKTVKHVFSKCDIGCELFYYPRRLVRGVDIIVFNIIGDHNKKFYSCRHLYMEVSFNV